MKLSLLSPAKALSKAYLKQSLKREQIEQFKANLGRMFERIRTDESEEHLKNIVADFLKDTWYKPGYEINTSGRSDLVIHNGPSSSDAVGVIIEVKRPSNTAEMITPERPNAKALHELLHYYLGERYLRNNKEIKHLIICNIFHWYVFDAADFERFFFANSKLIKAYREWSDGLFGLKNTDWFYQEMARPFIEKELEELSSVHFDLRDYAGANGVRLVSGEKSKTGECLPKTGEYYSPLQGTLPALYKIFSPQHLLKHPFGNDTNSLNREFYSELLHVIGLEEVKDKGKKLISRKADTRRDEGSLLENTINILRVRNIPALFPYPEQLGATDDERYFSLALELCITWLNRILFLKLLEGQLCAYHHGNRDYAFLSTRRIADFDELEELFFEVLARRHDERIPSVRDKFGAIPYLNSSLFEESDMERATIHLTDLKGRLEMPIFGGTVLKDATGKRVAGKKNTLHYLFEFLDAFDFSGDGGAEIQETAKSIINPSILGLIFEKINGYRDGSFFTPGFITMYICRETIRRAVVRKFQENWEGFGTVTNFEGLKDRLDWADREVRIRANALVDSLRVCDPAVGSGHFLVSALNEIIAVKSDLGILNYRDGGAVRNDYAVTVENDELIVTDRSTGELFTYVLRPDGRADDRLQRLQEALFHEKQDVIENCLFGVDINPKSVAICRLRLWIELLKNAYYRRPSPPAPLPQGARGASLLPNAGEGELETLPNIDINIKCGNSLVSRFAVTGAPAILPGDRKKLKELTEKYRRHVFEYKLSPANKAQLRKVIDRLKEDLSNFGFPNDRDLSALRKKKNELAQLSLFAYDKAEAELRQKLHAEVDGLERRLAEKQNSVYRNAFEWRFEFPEVLDENGEFTGFDIVVGNPPYIRHEAIKEQKATFAEMFGSFYCGTADLYTYFYKTGLDILAPHGLLCYIAPNKFMRAGYGKNTRELLTTCSTPRMILDFGDLTIFDEATTYPAIVLVEKNPPQPPFENGGTGGICLVATFTDPTQLAHLDETVAAIGFPLPVSALATTGWTLERPDVLALMAKLRNVGTPLGEYVDGKFYYGIKTGRNEAFVIDEVTRQRLVDEDPKSAEVIKPWLRGRDIKKWRTEWAQIYLITIASSANKEWPWSKEMTEATARPLFERAYPSVHRHLSQLEDGLRIRDDKGTFWWELRSCAYWDEFERAKICWSHFAMVAEFVYDEQGFLSNDKSYIMPTEDLSVLGILNSKLTNFFIGRISPPVSGGFMELRKIYLEQLPIPPATDEQKAAITELVQKILAAKRPPPNPLLNQEVKQKSPLLDKEGPGVVDILPLEAEIDRLVYALYGLTDEEIAFVETQNLASLRKGSDMGCRDARFCVSTERVRQGL